MKPGKIFLKESPWPAFPTPPAMPARTFTAHGQAAHRAALEVLHALIPDEPATLLQALPLEVKGRQAAHHRSGQADHREGSDPARAGARKPRHARRIVHHAEPVRGLQLILPGEIAPSHRHSQSALRFIVEGSGAYTAVDGERTTMVPGDFIITPSWTFHDHGNPGNEPVVWMDGLDIRIVELFAAQFHEVYPKRCAGNAQRRRGNGALWERTRAAGRGSAVWENLADIQLPVCAQPRVARFALARSGSRSLPRLEDAVHQSAHRRPCHADDRGVHPALAQWLPFPALSLDRWNDLFSGGRRRARHQSVQRASSSSRATRS